MRICAARGHMCCALSVALAITKMIKLCIVAVAEAVGAVAVWQY
jgi:hypothetical protein